MILTLFLVPIVAGVLAYSIKSDVARRTVLAGAAAAHAGLTASAWATGLMTPIGPFRLDPPGLLCLSITSVLFLAAAVYGVGYLAHERRTGHVDIEERTRFSNEPETIFTACLLLFLGTMSFVAVTHDFGLLWVGVEMTTLVSAPLIYFHRQHRSLEATWKYLLICSVGIALALLGNFLLAVAASGSGASASGSMILESLVKAGPQLRVPWLKAAFIFFLVGYGTKMGLAPLHTWLPDAHSEAPSAVSALMSGALLNCAFLGILRVHQVCLAAGIGPFSQDLLKFFGLLSMGIAAVFILGQTDFKRMLAYSSVEHMGILALGTGLGRLGSHGAAMHAVGHSLTKGALFLVAGNILAAYGTKTIRDVTGLRRVLPASGILWLFGFLAITGSPPFSPFVSELTILRAALDRGDFVVAGFYLAFLVLIFIGMVNLVPPMVQGRVADGPARVGYRDALWSVAPPAVLGLGVLILGLHIPGPLASLLESVAQMMGGS